MKSFKEHAKLNEASYPGNIGIMELIKFKQKANDEQKKKFDSHVNKITVRETLYVEPVPKIEWFFGGVAGFDKVNIVNFVGPSLLLKDKKDKVYSLGIGYSNAKTVSVQGGIYWLINLKK